MSLRLCLVAALLALAPPTARAEAALAAISANFAETAEALLPLFHDATGHDLTLTTGSTGKLHAQIAAGAPFDLLLSADAQTPAALIAQGHAVAGSAFTYATGRLTLWSADPDRIGADGRAALTDPGLRFVAIANPDLAPYGVAARETLQTSACGRRCNPGSSWARISARRRRWSPPARPRWASSHSRRAQPARQDQGQPLGRARGPSRPDPAECCAAGARGR